MNEKLKRKWSKDGLYKIIKVIAIIEISLFTVWLLNFSFGYFIEKMYMTYKLNRIPNVKVVDIWGNEDLDLEEIGARLIVNDTNEIVLYYLSKDVFNYPKTVYISEINDKKFIPFYPGDYGWCLDIGTESIIGKELGMVFNTPEDVIKNIDKLDSFFNNLKTAPELNYFCDTTTKTEMYLGIKYIKGDEKHPVVNFDYGYQTVKEKRDKMSFAKTLDWKYWENTETPSQEVSE